jgi:hypothetical protein
VNRRVVGSSPSWGALLPIKFENEGANTASRFIWIKIHIVRYLPIMRGVVVMLKGISLLTCFCLAVTLTASAQSTKTLTSPKPIPTPGGIRLLDGYTHTRLQGIDTGVGKISKPGGMTIEYDNGVLAGLYARQCWSKTACLWFKRQMIGGREVWLGLTKEGQIIATFPKEYANFFAQTKSSEDIADFLIMILTYRADEAVLTRDKPAVRKPKRR